MLFHFIVNTEKTFSKNCAWPCEFNSQTIQRVTCEDFARLIREEQGRNRAEPQKVELASTIL